LHPSARQGYPSSSADRRARGGVGGPCTFGFLYGKPSLVFCQPRRPRTRTAERLLAGPRRGRSQVHRDPAPVVPCRGAGSRARGRRGARHARTTPPPPTPHAPGARVQCAVCERRARGGRGPGGYRLRRPCALRLNSQRSRILELRSRVVCRIPVVVEAVCRPLVGP
jgi:hypothetical protein